MSNTSFDNWCVIELFGHQKIIGRVTEQTIGGQTFIRVDVPETKLASAFTRMFGAGAIYSITPVSEELARRMAEGISVRPINVYELAPVEDKPQLQESNESDEYDT